MAAAIGMFNLPTDTGLAGFSAIAAFAGLIGMTWTGIDAANVYNVRRRYGNLAGIVELAATAQTPELTYLLTTRERGIEPRCIIEGKEYFDVADFGDAAVLLRPAESPANPGPTLLRPAVGGATPGSSLLMPADENDANHQEPAGRS